MDATENMGNNTAYRLLGIDPGTNVLGYAVLEVEKRNIRLAALGVVTMEHLEDHPLKLRKIFEEVLAMIRRFEPAEMAIEAPFYAKNVQSMLKLGRAQGVAIAAAMIKGVQVTEYSPRKIKQSVTGRGNASKEQVAAMLEQILHIKLDEQYSDTTDALGAAVCHFFQSGMDSAKRPKKFKGWKEFIREHPNKVQGS